MIKYFVLYIFLSAPLAYIAWNVAIKFVVDHWEESEEGDRRLMKQNIDFLAALPLYGWIILGPLLFAAIVFAIAWLAAIWIRGDYS